MFRSRIRIISGFNSEAGSGWRKAKMAHKRRKKYKNVILQGLNVGRGCKFEVLNRSLIFNCPLLLIFGTKTWSGSWNRFRIIPGHRSPDHFDADSGSSSRFKAGSGPESSEQPNSDPRNCHGGSLCSWKAHNGATEAQQWAIKAQKPCRPLVRSWRLGSH